MSDSIYDDSGFGSVKFQKRWSKEEDERLKNAINLFGETSWKTVSDYVETRDNMQCRQRWLQAIKPGLCKGKWTNEEDDTLKVAVGKHGTNWTELAKKLPGRTPKQCREQWHLHLSPALNRSKFTDEEDGQILEYHEKFGNKWAKIATELGTGRTETMVRSRYNNLIRTEKHKKEREVQKYMDLANLIGPLYTNLNNASASMKDGQDNPLRHIVAAALGSLSTSNNSVTPPLSSQHHQQLQQSSQPQSSRHVSSLHYPQVTHQSSYGQAPYPHLSRKVFEQHPFPNYHEQEEEEEEDQQYSNGGGYYDYDYDYDMQHHLPHHSRGALPTRPTAVPYYPHHGTPLYGYHMGGGYSNHPHHHPGSH